MNLNIDLLKVHRNVHFNGLSNTLWFISDDIKCVFTSDLAVETTYVIMTL